MSHRAPYATPPEYQRVKRQVLWRLYNLGYRLETLSRIDQEIADSTWRRARNDEPGHVERYGKKYSWIAFYDLAGYRQDRGLLDRDDVRISDADIDPSFPEAPASPKLFGPWIDATAPVREWMRSDFRPAVVERLIVESFDDIIGPWVVLDGYVSQTTPDKSIFTFLRGLLVRTPEVATAIGTLSGIEYPGNFAIPQEEGEHYTYAGEIPWADTWRPRQYPAAIGTGSNEVAVFVPVRGYAWESYHSAENQLGGMSFPSRELAEDLDLYVRIPKVSMAQGGSTRIAMLPVLSGTPFRDRESLVLLRRDLLDQYLARHDLRLILFVWGERRSNYQVLGVEQAREAEGQFELSEILHKQGFIYEGGAFRQFY